MQKTTTIKIRTTEEEKELLKRKSITREISLSDYLLQRALVNKDLTADEKLKLKNLMTNSRRIGG